MTKKLFVGGIPWSKTNTDLAELFKAHGPVETTNVVMDPETGRSKGFGFVVMADEGAAKKAREELNQSDWDGRTIIVDWAKPRPTGHTRSKRW